MTTRQELEKMAEEFAIECAMKRHKGLNEVEVIPTGTYCGAKSGAAFAMDKLMPKLNAANERIKELEAENKRILNLARDFGDLMETINIHGGYQFSQPIIKFKQSLTPPERGEK